VGQRFELGQRVPIWRPRLHVAVVDPRVDPVPRGHQSGQYRGAAGRVHGVDAIGLVKLSFLLRQRINMGRVDLGIAIAA